MTDKSRGMQQRAGGPSRRAALVAAGLPLLLAACRGVQSLGTPPPPPRDIGVLRGAIASEEQLIAGCSAALGTLSASEQAAVRTVQAEHAAHLAQLRSRLVEPSPPPPPSPHASPTTGPSAGGSPAATLQALEQAEQAASDRLMGQLGGLPPALAQLLASIAASEATHVPFLRQAGGTAR